MDSWSRGASAWGVIVGCTFLMTKSPSVSFNYLPTYPRTCLVPGTSSTCPCQSLPYLPKLPFERVALKHPDGTRSNNTALTTSVCCRHPLRRRQDAAGSHLRRPSRGKSRTSRTPPPSPLEVIGGFSKLRGEHASSLCPRADSRFSFDQPGLLTRGQESTRRQSGLRLASRQTRPSRLMVFASPWSWPGGS